MLIHDLALFHERSLDNTGGIHYIVRKHADATNRLHTWLMYEKEQLEKSKKKSN